MTWVERLNWLLIKWIIKNLEIDHGLIKYFCTLRKKLKLLIKLINNKL